MVRLCQKLWLSILLTIVLCSFASAQTVISDCQDLSDIRYDISGDYLLAHDIDCSNTSNWVLGFEPINGTFIGTFDGRGYSIRDVWINTTPGGALFSSLNGTIQDVKLENFYIDSTSYSGALASYHYGTISNIDIINATVIATSDSGLMAGRSYGTIIDSSAQGNISASSLRIGGLVAHCNGQVVRSHVESSIYKPTTRVGGLCAFNYDGSIINQSYAEGYAEVHDAVNGGLISSATGSTIIDSYTSDFQDKIISKKQQKDNYYHQTIYHPLSTRPPVVVQQEPALLGRRCCHNISAWNADCAGRH